MESTPSGLRAIVIGSGSAGLTVGLGLANMGRKVAIVEKGAVGGDCTNTGCIPSKALIHRSRTEVDDPWPAVRGVRDGLAHEEGQMLEDAPNVEFVRGAARVVAVGHVAVDQADGTVRHLRAPEIVVASGSKPRTIDIDGLDPDEVLTNETFFELDRTPAHLVVIGGGPIAVELALAVRRLGAEVTMVEADDRVLSREDPEASAIVEQSLRDHGIAVHLGTTAARFDRDARTLHLASGRAVASVDRVLMAIGREPRLDGLGLASLGLGVGGAPLVTDSWGRTGVSGIWAAGDVTGTTATTHGAGAMARRTVQAIGFPKLPKLGRPPTIPSAVFSDPEVASVGLSLAAIRARWPEEARMRIRVDLADTDRGLTDGIEAGAVMVDVERFTGRVLRATVVGPAAAEMIGIFTLAIDRRISMFRLFRLVHPYPAYADAIGKVTDQFTFETLGNLPGEGATWLRSLPRVLRSSRR